MRHYFPKSNITAPLTLALVALVMALTTSVPLARAGEQQNWTGHIDNQAYLDRYYGRSSEPTSSYSGGSSTGYSHRPGYGGVTTIVVEKSRYKSSHGIVHRNGNSSFIYHDGYRPNYYKPGHPKYKRNYYKHSKPNYGKPHYKKHHPPAYVVPRHPGYKSRNNQRYPKYRIQVPRKHGYSNYRGGSRR
ncbi:hypothetical protein [Desulfosediminicola ganghwensis]|uniref:hypothetical protein n=1 Tax=Desulfosediminicola ganghwensis TaxID=2569540 RepID=UPI0010ACB83B|nr:hypothetical protein [Desulfosediminicola ganghwensis]